MSEIRLKSKDLKYRADTGKIIFTVDNIEEFPEWPDTDLIELINGELYMVHSPTTRHQRISSNIEYQIQSFLVKNSIGEIFHAPIDVELSKENLIIPDIIFISNEQENIIKKKRIVGVPTLIIEILSSNRERDLIEKKALYEKFKVLEYIIIDPEKDLALKYLLDNNNRYGKVIKVKIPGKIVINSLNKLEISL